MESSRRVEGRDDTRERTRTPYTKSNVAAGGVVSVLILFVLARGVLVAAIIPPFNGCDEAGHFNYVQHLAETGSLPQQTLTLCGGASAETNRATAFFLDGIAFHPKVAIPDVSRYQDSDPADASVRETTGCGPHSFYPPLYYLTSALAYESAAGEPLLVRLYRSRLASVVWGMVAAVAGLVIGLRLFGTRRDAVLLASLVVLQPMIAFLTSVVNSDAAVIACATCCTAAVACLWKRPSTAALIALGAFACLGALSKLTFCFVVPLLFVVAVIALGAARFRSWLTVSAAFVPFGAATVGWQLFSRAGSADRLSGKASPLRVMDYLRDSVFQPDRLGTIWGSGYWMSWGWLDTKIPKVDYLLICAFVAAAVLGIVLGRNRITAREKWAEIAILVYTPLLIVALYGIEYVVMAKTGEPGFVQGRYLLTLYPAEACLMVGGLRQLARHLRVRVDPAWVFAALLAVLNISAIQATLYRYYHV